MMKIEHAHINDLDVIKKLCDAHRVELGFVMRPSLASAVKTKEILIACNISNMERECLGFVHYHHRRDLQTTLYHLAVNSETRMIGIGRALVVALRDEARDRQKNVIRLKCPETLPANSFYEKVGFVKVFTEPGKSRPLCVWEMSVV